MNLTQAYKKPINLLFVLLGGFLLTASAYLLFDKPRLPDFLDSSDGGLLDQAERERFKQNVSVRPSAEMLAKDFLSRQSFKDEYEAEPSGVDNFSEFWNVWFNKKDESARPNKGLVQVNKTTGEAEWKLLQ